MNQKEPFGAIIFSVYSVANPQSEIKLSNDQFHMIFNICAVTILFKRSEERNVTTPGWARLSNHLFATRAQHAYYATKFFNREFKMIDI